MKKFLVLLIGIIFVSFIVSMACIGSPDAAECDITFNVNGGNGGPDSTIATFNRPMPALSAPPPTRNGYRFLGYYDTRFSGGIKYYNSDLSSAKNWDKKESAILYARWIMIGEGSVVSMVRSNKSQASALTFDDIKALVEEAVELAGGLGGIVKYGDTVILKPNLITTYYNWGTSNVIPQLVNGVCTDYRVVKAAAQIVRAIVGPKGASGSGRILVMEGSGSGGSTRNNFNNAGYTMANLPEVDEIIALDEEGTWTDGTNSSFVTKVDLKNFLYNSASGAYLNYYKNDGVYYVNKKMYEANAIICLPVLKNHWNAVVTGSIKNMAIGGPPPRVYGVSGTNIGRNNMVNHNTIAFHQWMADYFAVLPADFTIMDALQGLENGPLPSASNAAALAGSQKNMRTILASRDALAIDIVQTNIINWDYTTVRYLQYLTEKGYAGTNPRKPVRTLNGDPKNITVLGNIKVDDIRTHFRGEASMGGEAPMAGGSRLTASQLTPPVVTITSASFAGPIFNLSLNVSDNTDKVDVYIDNNFIKSISDNFDNISIDASSVANGSRSIMVRSYNQFMRHNSASTTAVK